MNEAVESNFIDKGIHYHVQLCIQQSDTFSILLIDEDQPERWEGLFNGQAISRLTTSAGNTKKVQIFYKMLQNAILNNSNEVSFTILSPIDINEMKNGSQSQSQMNDNGSTTIQLNHNESRYFILEQRTEFDRVKYPLRLFNRPYTTEELKTIIRTLKSENKRLSSFEQTSNQRDKVRNLEQQIYDLNGSIRQLAEEKDHTIEILKQKIADLEEKARVRNAKMQNSTITRQKTIRSNNNNSTSKNSYGSKKKPMVPTIGRATVNTKYQTKNSRFSSASSSAAGSRKSSATSSRKSSAACSRKSSAVGSRKSSAASSRSNSARSSASNSRPSSRNSNGSFKRFNPTEWVLNHQHSGGGSRNSSRNNSRNPSPNAQILPKNSYSSRGTSQNDVHLKRLRALVQKKYI